MEERAKAAASWVCSLIQEFHTRKDEGTLRLLIATLLSVQVSVPMRVSMEDADVEQFLRAKEGDSITTGGQIRMKPDMLKNDGGELFFPAFTQKEETPEGYRNSFSWITMDFMNCVHSAYANESCAGVVINGFSDPFVVNRPLLKLMLDLEASKKADAQ